MTMTKTALLFGTTDLGHLGDDQETQMTKIGRPKKEGALGHGHRLSRLQTRSSIRINPR